MVDVTANNAAYQEFTDALHARGIKTTSINSAKEADFGDYGSALSPELRQMLCDSFDCDQDYILQQQIAGLYTNRSVLQSGQFISACKGMGLNVHVEYVSTTYISDYKAGNFSNNARNGAIAVYTISDGMGGEIKIADANGNGALESEELFMNEILNGINNDIGNITPAVLSSTANGPDNGGHPITADMTEEEVAQTNFDTRVEKYIEQGYSETTAVLRANSDFGVNMHYTGTMVQDNGNSDTEVTQRDFDGVVKEYVDAGFDQDEAIKMANSYFDVDMDYTGI